MKIGIFFFFYENLDFFFLLGRFGFCIMKIWIFSSIRKILHNTLQVYKICCRIPTKYHSRNFTWCCFSFIIMLLENAENNFSFRLSNCYISLLPVFSFHTRLTIRVQRWDFWKHLSNRFQKRINDFFIGKTNYKKYS